MKLRETRRLKCQASRAKTYRTTFYTQNLRIDTASHCSNSPESSRRHWQLCWREKGLRLAWHPLRRFRARRVISMEILNSPTLPLRRGLKSKKRGSGDFARGRPDAHWIHFESQVRDDPKI